MVGSWVVWCCEPFWLKAFWVKPLLSRRHCFCVFVCFFLFVLCKTTTCGAPGLASDSKWMEKGPCSPWLEGGAQEGGEGRGGGRKGVRRGGRGTKGSRKLLRRPFNPTKRSRKGASRTLQPPLKPPSPWKLPLKPSEPPSKPSLRPSLMLSLKPRLPLSPSHLKPPWTPH